MVANNPGPFTYLGTGTTSPPTATFGRVQNHSYVDPDTDPDDPGILDALRRLDYAVKRDNFVAVAAVNNGGTTAIPAVGSTSPAYALSPSSDRYQPNPTSRSMASESAANF